MTYPPAEILSISFRSLLRGRFLDVTQRSPQIKVSLWGALHDIQKMAAKETNRFATSEEFKISQKQPHRKLQKAAIVWRLFVWQ
mgnify:FL=1